MRDGGQDVLYGMNGLIDHQLTEAVVFLVTVTTRRIAGPRALNFLRLQLDVLGRTSVTLQQSTCNVSVRQHFIRICDYRCGTLILPTRRMRTERISSR